MAVTSDKVITILELQDRTFNAQVRANEAQFTKAKQREAVAAEQSERRIRAASAGIKSALLASAASIAAAFSVQAVANLADGYTRFTNQLKLAGLEGTELADTQDALFASAQRYGVQLEGLGTLYGRVSQAGKELGATNEDLLKFTNGVAAAIKIQGASAGSVQGALLQLSQALGGVNVRAEEYNSINEGARPILVAVANGSDRFKGSVNALRAAVIAGTVTSREFYEAFLKGSTGLEEQATRANLTIGASLQTLNNALGKYIGETDASLSATERVGQAITALANNLDTIIPIIGVLITLVGTRYVAALLASTGATIGQTAASIASAAALRGQATAFGVAAAGARALGASMMALAGGPIGLAILAVAGLAAGLLYLNDRYGEAAVAQRELEATTEASDRALGEYEKAQIAAKNATGDAAVAARTHAAAMREEAQAAIVAARAIAAKRTAMAQERLETASAAYAEATSGRPTEEGAAIGQLAFAAGAQREARLAQERAAAAIREQIRQEQEFQRISAGVNLGGGGGPPPAADAAAARRGRGASGPTAEEMEAMRERLRLQNAYDLARAQGNEAAALAAQRELDIISLTEEMKRAGIANAKEAATVQIDAIMAAEAANREVDKLIEQSERRTENRVELEERRLAAMDRQLETQLALARIEGNEALVILLERELDLRRQIAGLGPTATREEVDQVRGDARMLNDAEDAARLRESAQDMAGEFISVLRSEDIGEEMGRRFRDAAFDKLEDILTNLFAQAMSGGPGGSGGGGNWVTAIASMFGGGRALGGPVKAGKIYKVNENTPNSELWSPSVSGYVHPTDPRAAQGAARQSIQNITVRNELYLAGANGDAVIYSNVRMMLDRSQRDTIRAVKAGQSAAMLENQLLRE